MKKFKLHWQILTAFILAVLFGIFVPHGSVYTSWMGDIFLRGLKMVIIPLILTSLISGITSIGNAGSLGRLGLKTITYYIATSTFAIITGLFLVNIFKPGVGADLNLAKEISGLNSANQSIKDTFINIIPTNIFHAFAENDMLATIFFAILFGFFITQVSEKAKTFMTDFFNAAFEIMMKVTLFILKFAPFGIFGLVYKIVAAQDNLMELFQRMGIYMLVVIGALIIHAAGTLPLLLRFIGKVNPSKHFNAVTTPLITAFSTASSSATLPLTMVAVEENSGVSNKITSFTLPLGATVNMDGTALYEIVAAMFIAQAYGLHPTIIQQVIMVVTALLASIGAAGIPMAGMVMISIVLSVMGLPLEAVGLILSVDPLLDMFRTSVNVWSDSCGAVIIAKSEGETLNV